MGKNVLMPLATPLATEVRALRKERGLSQTEFSELVGLSSAMIGHIEAGRRSIGIEGIDGIVEALNLGRAHRAALNTARKMTSAMLSAQREAMGEGVSEVAALREQVMKLADGMATLGLRVEALEQARAKDEAAKRRGGSGSSAATG